MRKDLIIYFLITIGLLLFILLPPYWRLIGYFMFCLGVGCLVEKDNN